MTAVTIGGGILRYASSHLLDVDRQADDLSPRQTAYAIKWAILAGIILLCLAFLVGGHIHARRRMEKGLPPLPYHKVS